MPTCCQVCLENMGEKTGTIDTGQIQSLFSHTIIETLRWGSGKRIYFKQSGKGCVD